MNICKGFKKKKKYVRYKRPEMSVFHTISRNTSGKDHSRDTRGGVGNQPQAGRCMVTEDHRDRNYFSIV